MPSAASATRRSTAGRSGPPRCLIRCPTDFGRTTIIRFLFRLFVAAYFVWAGLVLVVAPWTAFWDRNLFALAQPFIASLMDSHFVRGAVTGIGVITTLAGLGDLAGAILARPTASEPDPEHPRP